MTTPREYLYIRTGLHVGDQEYWVLGLTWRSTSPSALGEVLATPHIALALAERFLTEHARVEAHDLGLGDGEDDSV